MQLQINIAIHLGWLLLICFIIDRVLCNLRVIDQRIKKIDCQSCWRGQENSLFTWQYRLIHVHPPSEQWLPISLQNLSSLVTFCVARQLLLQWAIAFQASMPTFGEGSAADWQHYHPDVNTVPRAGKRIDSISICHCVNLFVFWIRCGGYNLTCIDGWLDLV